jgi:hypothetical protein
MHAAYRPLAVFATTLLAGCGGTIGHQTADLVSKPNDSKSTRASGGLALLRIRSSIDLPIGRARGYDG